MTTEMLRALPLTGCGNFRDLGGYQTADGHRLRWRRLFRSDSLHQLTAEDLESLRDEGIDLALGFDLRTALEIETSGIGPLYDGSARHLHTPFIADVADSTQRYGELSGGLGELYLRMVVDARTCVATFFDTLADESSYPMVFYCSAGKDRTGMMTALLLRSLGVSGQQIGADYELTETLTLERLRERLASAGREIPEEFLFARPETILGFIAAIEAQSGSVEQYLEDCGVTPETLAAVRALLLEE